MTTTRRAYPWKGQFKTIEAVERYLSGETLTCLICGREFADLARHLFMAHKTSPRAYRLRFGIPYQNSAKKKIGLVGRSVRERRRAITLRNMKIGAVPPLGKGDPGRGSTKQFVPISTNALRASMSLLHEARRARSVAREVQSSRLPPERIMRAAREAVPAGLPDHVRDDVASEMMLAMFEGRLALRDLGRRVREYLAAHYRIHPTRYGPLSLDEPRFEDGRATLGDTIASTAFHF